MTRKTWPSAFICGSHICNVQPSEFDSITVGPLCRPSTETLSRHPSASIIGMLSPLLFSAERSEQAIDQGLRAALIAHRLQQCCDLVCGQLRLHLGVFGK